MKAIQPSLASFWQTFIHDRNADIQMPFYMFYTWVWARIVGPGEWSLHLANLPWFVAGAAAFILSFPAGGHLRKFAIYVAMFCPFAWYYLDEARPYTMQLGASLLIIASLRGLQQTGKGTIGDSSGHLVWFLAGVIVLSGSSMLGMLWAGAAVASLPLLLGWERLVSLLRRHLGIWLIAALPLLLFAAFYLWTLKSGARASAAATTTVASAFYAVYELLGFTGLGPGRLEMRDAGPSALRGHMSGVVPYGVATALVAGAAVAFVLGSGNRKRLAVAVCCCVPPAFILAVGWVAHFRVLGRHMAPFVPIWLLLLTSGLTALWARRGMGGQIVVVVFCGLSLLSCLSVRFSARHAKDNYRAAAAMARTALQSGQLVWWNAAEEGARYYNVPVGQSANSSGEAVFLMNPTRESLDKLAAPHLIVASKPDVYDSEKALAEYIRAQGFVPAADFAAFVIWEKGSR